MFFSHLYLDYPAVWFLTFKSGAEVGIFPFLFVWQTEIPIYTWLPALPAVV